MKAVIAGTAGVAVPLMLQGCAQDENITSMSCEGADAKQCITANSDGTCHWDPETSVEECLKADDYDDVLFQETYTEDPEDTLIVFSDADAERDEIAGCEDFEAVPAQRLYSKCQVFPEYSIASRGDEDKTIRWTDMSQRNEFMVQNAVEENGSKVAFRLPLIADAELDGTEGGVFGNYLAAWAAFEGGADWSAYGAEEIALGQDARLECIGFVDPIVQRLMDSSDPRYVDDGEDQIYLKLFPGYNNEPTEADANDQYQFVCGGKTNKAWRREAKDADAKYDGNVELYWDEVIFADQEPGFGAQAWYRFKALSKFAQTADTTDPEFVGTVSLHQPDLEAGVFLRWNQYNTCHTDRNCGLDFTDFKCIEVADYCSQFDAASCPTFEFANMIPHFDEDSNAYLPKDLNAPRDVAARKLMFAGTAFFNLDGSNDQYLGEDGQPATTRAAKCAVPVVEEEDAAAATCQVHHLYQSCETIGVPTQDPGQFEYNIAHQVYPKAIRWDPELYDQYDLTTFSTNYMIDDSESNPRGCVVPSDDSSNSYRNGAFGYPGALCTHPLGWDCSVAGVEAPAEEEEGAEATGDEETGDEETGDEAAPFVSAEACTIGLETICAYKPASDGECVFATDYYAKYFDADTDEALYESVVVTMKPVEEESQEEEDLDAADEGDENGDGPQEDENGESSFVEGVRA